MGKQIFDKVQEVFRKRSHSAPRMLGNNFILRGVLRCKNCGCLITAEIKKGKFIYYSCSNGKHICKRLYVREEELLKPIYEKLDMFGSIPLEIQERLVNELRKLNESESVFHQRERERVSNEIARYSAKIDRLTELLVDGSITKDEYDKKLEIYKDSQYKLNLELEENLKGDHEYHINVATILDLSRRMKEIFESSEVGEKRQIVNFLLQNPVLNGKKLEFTLKKPFDTVLELANCPSWLRAARELRTVILSGWHSYEMDAAVKMLRGEEPFTEEAMRWMERAK